MSALRAGEGDVLDGARDDEQRVGVEEVEVLVREEDEEGRADGEGGHQVGQEGHGVDVGWPTCCAASWPTA